MKSGFRIRHFLPLLLLVGLVLAGGLTAQTFTTLHNFGGSDGAYPQYGLFLSAGTLYGTTTYGGSSGYGTVFAINTDGSGFKNLHNFSGSEGHNPTELILWSNVIYGTTVNGGNSGSGTVFALNTDGTGFRTLYSFSALDGRNTDGAFPAAHLILSGSTLYGTASQGGTGTFAGGTVFKVNTDGTGFANLYSFNFEHPYAGLVLEDRTLYGKTLSTVFALNTDGSAFNTLYSSGGAGEIVLSSDVLYGTTSGSSVAGYGTVFAINTDGSGFTTLHHFGGSDGAHPQCGLNLWSNTLYGTAQDGGSSGNGTIFSISLPVTQPQLTTAPAGANIVLSWPTNFTGFYLQDTVNLAAGGWISTTLPQPPIIVNGQFVVTIPKPASGQHFYRLSQ